MKQQSKIQHFDIIQSTNDRRNNKIKKKKQIIQTSIKIEIESEKINLQLNKLIAKNK